MQKQERKKLPGWIILTLVALIAAVLLAATNLLTKKPIEQRAELADQQARQQVLPLADSFEEMSLEEESGDSVEKAFVGKRSDEVVGYIAQSITTGYAGEIQTIVGMDLQGSITGITVGGANFSETAGLGAKAKDAAFTEQFKDKKIPVELKTDIDAISGATITTRAVVNGVNQAGGFMMKKAGLSSESEGGVPQNVVVKGNTAVATVDGFAGPIEITVTVDDQGVITDFEVGGKAFAETEGYGARAKEESYVSTFIGKSAPLEKGKNIDTLSSATITTQAVIQGANDALTGLANGSNVKIEGNKGSVMVTGYVGEFDVAVEIDDTGEIISIEVGKETFEETAGIGTQAQEESYLSTFIGKKAPLVEKENIDVVSGATYTSKAVIEGANEILSALGYGGEGPSAAGATEQTLETPKPVGETAKIPSDALVGEAAGHVEGSIVRVFVSVDDQGVITDLVVGDEDFKETAGLGTKVQEKDYTDRFIGKSAPVKVDAISNATVSSDAVVKAVNNALKEGITYEAFIGSQALEKELDITEHEDGSKTVKEQIITDTGELVLTLKVKEKTVVEIQLEGGRFSPRSEVAKESNKEFLQQFSEKEGPFEMGKTVQPISGDEKISEKIIAAINDILEIVQ
ncbi:MAG: RnfABCDGE type electron transport complex subunit G [Clostridiales bacterium]|nr:RnfABCDGE type electron transport complex subunit G [Clostridiales bacterium]